MPTLTDAQKRQIIAQEPRRGAQYIFDTIQMYDNLSLDDFPNMRPDKRSIIQVMINSVPNPQEQSEWRGIDGDLQQDLNTAGDNFLGILRDKLNQYVAHWGNLIPFGNHVQQAKNEIAKIEAELCAREQQREALDWNALNKNSPTSLKGFLDNHPKSTHRSEIDDMFWAAIDKGDKKMVHDYLNTFPMGSHVQEAKAYDEWGRVQKDDIFDVNTYIKNHPSSPLIQIAQNTFDDLKHQEISKMKYDSSSYSEQRFRDLISRKIFGTKELVDDDVVPENVMKTLCDSNSGNGLDISGAISAAIKKPSCKAGYTDVYFFGIPSTGKTCILMGLMRSRELMINNTTPSGTYADQLKIYAEKGFTVPRTEGTFSTTIEATMYEKDSDKIKYGINLVEMSGEEFAFEIAANPKAIVSFESMGGNVAKNLLGNNNRKVFFLIIDPTADYVTIQRDVEILDPQGKQVLDDMGNPMYETVYATVSQDAILTKMLNLFQDENNAEIMKKVDSIHFIVTKSDTLAVEKNERNEIAKRIFDEKFSDAILKGLRKLCRDKNINTNTNFSPKLYTFSLGRFSIGGLFGYEPSDTDFLVKAIRNATPRFRVLTFWDKFKRMCN